jgi:hypothetical protein
MCVSFGTSGAKVCQRTGGCHMDGDLCRKDSDCCGAPGTGLPGEGNGSCQFQPGQDVGVCRLPKGCNPEGNVCGMAGESCGFSSARKDCCGAAGDPTACQLDPLGVPRCRAIKECRKPAQTCSHISDCCDSLPCVPDPNGVLRCATLSADAGASCIPAGGPCTAQSDCCPDIECNIAIGSTQGMCGEPTPDAAR